MDATTLVESKQTGKYEIVLLLLSSPFSKTTHAIILISFNPKISSSTNLKRKKKYSIKKIVTLLYNQQPHHNLLITTINHLYRTHDNNTQQQQLPLIFLKHCQNAVKVMKSHNP